MAHFSHLNEEGKAKMVDVSKKKIQLRKASAEGHIKLNRETIDLIRENNMKKGDVLNISEIAGIQAAKQTSLLIPLCHPLRLTNIGVKAELDNTGVKINSEVTCIGQTGVEMEALTAVSVALLTVYDMCKSVDKKMLIDLTELISKTKNEIT